MFTEVRGPGWCGACPRLETTEWTQTTGSVEIRGTNKKLPETWSPSLYDVERFVTVCVYSVSVRRLQLFLFIVSLS